MKKVGSLHQDGPTQTKLVKLALIFHFSSSIYLSPTVCLHWKPKALFLYHVTSLQFTTIGWDGT